jgi:hypothetical protein
MAAATLGIPLFLEMLTYKRPAGTDTEEQFIRKYVAPTGAEPDRFGNYILRIGGAPIAWCAHTDTVHRTPGRQRLRVRNGIASVRQRRPKTVVRKVGKTWHSSLDYGECLGADDTTGVWLMLEMIRANVPGLYLFHRGEEIGCQGSGYIATHTPDLLDGILYAISFDRRGTDSIVTHQLMHRTASDEFAWSLSDAIGLEMVPDDTGVFTDSNEYAHIVPECTNVSVGYDQQHTAHETQDLAFVAKLRDRMCKIDLSRLVVEREPALPDYGRWSGGDEWSTDDWGCAWCGTDRGTFTKVDGSWCCEECAGSIPAQLPAGLECGACGDPIENGHSYPFASSEICRPCWRAVMR